MLELAKACTLRWAFLLLGRASTGVDIFSQRGQTEIQLAYLTGVANAQTFMGFSERLAIALHQFDLFGNAMTCGGG